MFMDEHIERAAIIVAILLAFKHAVQFFVAHLEKQNIYASRSIGA